MHWIDWAVLVVVMTWIVYDGLKRTKDSQELDGYFLAKRSIPWWAAGISVMATQLSAITMIGTTGQGYNDGLRFIQLDAAGSQTICPTAGLPPRITCGLLNKQAAEPGRDLAYRLIGILQLEAGFDLPRFGQGIACSRVVEVGDRA